jgi:hypothetical protein
MAARVAAYALAALALAHLARGVDLAAVGATLSAVGPLAPLALLPATAEMGLEAMSYRLLLRRLGYVLPWRGAVLAHLRAEAIRLSLPGGPALAEGFRPVAFARHAGAFLGDATAALAVRKLAHLGTHGVFLAAGASLGLDLVARAVPALPAGPRAALPWAVGGTLTLAAVLLAWTLLHGSVVTRAERALSAIASGRLASMLERRRAEYAAVDARLRQLIGSHPALVAWNVATALASWCTTAVESWALLRLVGARTGVGEVLALESVVSLLRSVAFAVPGGLGVQDLGYHALLRGAVGDGPAAAFVLLKRARDLCWLAAGWALPALLDRARGPSARRNA